MEVESSIRHGSIGVECYKIVVWSARQAIETTARVWRHRDFRSLGESSQFGAVRANCGLA